MKLSTTILSLVAGLSIAQAATVSVSSLPGGSPVPIAGRDGKIIAKGTGFVALGTFGADASFADVASIQAAFTQFGDAVGMGLGNFDGVYQNTITATVGGTGFSGAGVFTVVGDGADLASSTGLLVVDHGFTFVDEPGATPGATVGLDSNIVFGGMNATQLEVNGQMFDALQVAPPIPEPSSALLGLLGLSFLAFRRRK